MKCCKGCEKRSATCHFEPPCKEYAEEAEQMRAYRKKYLRQNEADSFRNENVLKTIEKNRKKGR